ncbi:PREDICTED: thioredoxin-related transmembrane protein 1 [Nanorana parkeri]|uniref:thioredoxin-related transmembrane protein 1 n=1 Tax=Nanorana parkeri TaxID=125878 RepID=UPI000854370D|nr:PREDICTED: thioredoxin-related transmembrane protein 1 [Nanorana parkeri]
MAPLYTLCLGLLLCLPPGLLAGKGDVIDITDTNWREILHGEWMIKFYAPWCPACQKLQPEWNEFSEWGEDLNVNIGKVDVTAQPGLSGRFIITALPTIYHCKDGVFRKYHGSRMHKDFISFVSEKEWEGLEPVSSWFCPDSLLMSAMSALFHLSMYIRYCHEYFVEDLDIPVWGSYLIFALFTLLLGLILGLLLVFVADYLCPTKRHRPQGYPHKKLSPEAARILKQMEEEQEKKEKSESVDNEESSENDVSRESVRKRTVKS